MLARFHRTRRGNDEGFTLIELLVVMIIIGILAAIAVPVFLTQREKARDTATKSDVTIVGKEVATYYVDGTAAIVSSVSAGSFKLCPDATCATPISTVKLSNGTVEQTAGTGFIATGISYNTGTNGTTCSYANNWIVALSNADGSTKNWFYSATDGLTSTSPLKACV